VPQKDFYEDLIRYYEFQIGRMPRRQDFKDALQATFSEDDLRIFFQLPQLRFDLKLCRQYANHINPNLRIIETSAYNQEGLDEWIAFLRERVWSPA
jgi:hypothetical protein